MELHASGLCRPRMLDILDISRAYTRNLTAMCRTIICDAYTRNFRATGDAIVNFTWMLISTVSTAAPCVLVKQQIENLHKRT